MLILALDTTTRAGSLALLEGDALIAAERGDAARAHGVRLPGEIVRLLARHRLALPAIDLFAVAVGPGSFTGLRVGIATMQGLALASGKGLVGVSALDALAAAVDRRQAADTAADTPEVAVWMDAQRHEVFAALYGGVPFGLLDGPLVAPPADVLVRWAPRLSAGRVRFVGDGALAYRPLVAARGDEVVEPTPLVAPLVAALAARAASAGPVPGPGAVRPLYVRRPDAELARERALAQAPR